MAPRDFVCLVDAIPRAERSAHFALLAYLFRQAVQETQSLPDGHAFRFSPETYDKVAQFVSRERLCCPFLTFEITVSAADDAVWLRMTGPDGVREFLAAELPTSLPAN